MLFSEVGLLVELESCSLASSSKRLASTVIITVIKLQKRLELGNKIISVADEHNNSDYVGFWHLASC